ncbi:unnamed protein product [Caenorhabditis sp. 36 PRJEB53466]|nr:unnamed protein product [Caenorhabditis sp. 36 PRJEB53466]
MKLTDAQVIEMLSKQLQVVEAERDSVKLENQKLEMALQRKTECCRLAVEKILENVDRVGELKKINIDLQKKMHEKNVCIKEKNKEIEALKGEKKAMSKEKNVLAEELRTKKMRMIDVENNDSKTENLEKELAEMTAEAERLQKTFEYQLLWMEGWTTIQGDLIGKVLSGHNVVLTAREQRVQELEQELKRAKDVLTQREIEWDYWKLDNKYEMEAMRNRLNKIISQS